MKNLPSILAPLQDDPNGLLQQLCQYVTDPILETIAEADYGHFATAYLDELKKIRRHQAIHQMHFESALSEVVELTRWKKPVDTKDKRVTKAQQDNLAIAFSCSILLMVPQEWYPNRMGESSSVIRLIQSSTYLEYVFPNLLPKVSPLLAWRITENGTDLEDIPFFMFGLLITLLKHGTDQEDQVIALIEHLLIVEQKAYEARSIHDPRSPKSSDWLFRTTFSTTLQEDWQSYRPFLSTQIDKVNSEALKTKLKQLVPLLA